MGANVVKVRTSRKGFGNVSRPCRDCKREISFETRGGRRVPVDHGTQNPHRCDKATDRLMARRRGRGWA